MHRLALVADDADGFLDHVGDDGRHLCSAFEPGVTTETFTVRPTFIVYMIAVASIVSWMIFFVYAGVGIVALPIDLVKSFLNRPVKVIPRSEYIRCATILARDAQTIHQQIKSVQKGAARDGALEEDEKRVKGAPGEALATRG